MHPNHQACARIFEQWHQRARSGDVESLLELYHPDAVLESPLIPRILEQELGVCRGHDEIRRFFVEGTRRRPNDLVRWYRTGRYFCDGQTVIWEYPRETPEGSQVDLVEVDRPRRGEDLLSPNLLGLVRCPAAPELTASRVLSVPARGPSSSGWNG